MAVPTVADFRGLLYRRVGEYAALADLDDAMARSARLTGLSAASPIRLVDADLVGMLAVDYDRFMDVAELRAWESILANATDPNLRDCAIDASPAEVREAAREKIKSLKDYVKAVYGIGLTTLETGTLGLAFQANGSASLDEWSD